MYLKKLEIQGFKSFADKVTLNFEKGVTAIVGPNGSGKSNISDAVRLVLGEQSIKSLRGSKLEDVIFAGSEKRKPLGFCEINLTLDNSDSYLPFDYTEVVVARKIFRSGESEFFINKTPCRLKDIYELFLDTGVGKEGYSIIGQGKIEEILSAKPEDRRQIFEEAVGISKFKYKKEEAEKKLAVANDNLVRLNDIIVELEKQLIPLEAQKRKAEEFLRLSKEKRKVDISLYVQLIKNLMKEYEIFSEKYEDLKAQLDDKKAQINQGQEDLTNKEKEIIFFQRQIDDKKEQYFNKLKDLETINGKRELTKEKLKNLSETSQLHKEELEKAKKKADFLVQELKKIETNVSLLYSTKNVLNKKLKELEEKYSNLQKEQKDRFEEVERSKEEIVDVLNSIADVKGKLSLYNSLKEDVLNREENIKMHIRNAKEQIKKLEEEKSKVESDLNFLSNLLNDKSKEVTVKKEKLHEVSNTLVSFENILKAWKEEYNRKKSQLSLLEEMDKNYEGYSAAVKNLLKLSEFNNDFKENIIGVVGELLEVESIYSTAIEVALGFSVQNIVIRYSNQVGKLIEVLKQKNLGRATFLPLDLVQGKKLSKEESKILNEKGVIGVACDVIKYDSSLDDIFKFLLGRVIVVDTIENAINLSKKYNQSYKIVTLEGEVINPGGAITGGSLKPKVQSIFRRKEEINNLKREIVTLEQGIKELTEAIEKIAKDKTFIEGQIRVIEQEISDINYKINQEKQREWSLKREIENLLSQVESYNIEIKQIKENIYNYQEEISKYLKELTSLENRKEEINALIEGFKETNNENVEILQALEKEITTLKIEIARTEQKLQNEVHNLKEKQQELGREKSNIEDKEKNINDIEALKKTLLSDEEKFEIQIEELQKEIEKIQTEISQLEEELSGNNKELEVYKEKFLILQQEYSDIKEMTHNIEINMQKYQIEIDNIKTRLWEEYELTLEKALQEAEYKEISYLKERANYLSKAIKDLGNVNVEAIEEYKEVKERYDFLKSQMEDIIKARETLISVIEETNKIIKTKFKDGFELIQLQFKETFKRLFGGGHAELILTDENNLLETGIEIKAQPPGKKLQNLSLLSGGEKALVAISLLFAMILIRPTPFCILDEIDAALDDTNVERFAQFLKELSKDTQFIVVTHRKGTMMIADAIYGVTMQEKGVSKLLSLKLNKDSTTGGLVHHA
ncbi:chromosome partition protein Smc [Thermoanaerobacter kivui]|uniref:Chromosome partition protein Smc n=1 Tax=Thermoanaerobacter kivui TaxID=2325 RepID=A0A097ARW8_THEKI|nr:chromosome segregation protein SMC [Thermoanaerobacter kivui]AIS52552.1 chromosome partition protein Smc [Thermoanaerobacter kivui]